jgi:hypothetical protein
MNLQELLEYNGDSTVTYKSAQSNKMRYTVCTVDFDNDHIRKFKKPDLKLAPNEVLVFCWDSDSYKKLKADVVTSVVALSQTLKNGG